MPRWLTALILALALTVVVASLATMWIVVESQRAAESRQEQRVEAVESAAQQVIDEIRNPNRAHGHPAQGSEVPRRKETFQRIERIEVIVRQLCAETEACEPP